MRTFARSTITHVITPLLLSLLSHPFVVESAFFSGSVLTTAAAKHVDAEPHYMKGIKESMTTPLRLYVVVVQSLDEARNAFFLWFFGASGGAGIARSAFPRMLRNFQTVSEFESDTHACRSLHAMNKTNIVANEVLVQVDVELNTDWPFWLKAAEPMPIDTTTMVADAYEKTFGI
jgi:hypothetical protein